jgi:SAM-dependent methyltransferase
MEVHRERRWSASAVRLLERLHDRSVHPRRVRILSAILAAHLPPEATVLDVGCGDGLLAHLIGQRRPDIRLVGIDIAARPRCHIPVAEFDGRTIPYSDGSFQTALMVDVLHHTDDPAALLAEARRVARGGVLVKDHLSDAFLAGPTLRFMYWVSNAHHGVALPYNYWRQREWHDAFILLGLKTVAWQKELGLYPWPASLIFDRSLHFVAYLTRE